MLRPRGVLWIALISVSLLLTSRYAYAQGGPPLLTDDPDTPGPRYWEINLSTFLQKFPHARLLEVPRVDINYGVGRNIQLKYELAWLNGSENHESLGSAFGNSVIGVKVRVFGQEKEHLAWSFYPQLEFNTGHSATEKGLETEGREFLLPTEVTFEAGRFEVNGEVGRTFVEDGDNGWIAGLAAEVTAHKRLEFLAEIHSEKSGDEPALVILNVGGREKLTKQTILMVAVGTAVGNAEEKPSLLFYAGLQFNFPNQFIWEKLPPKIRK